MNKEYFLKVTREGHFFDHHQKVLIAVSGGLDSMNLLHLLYQFREELGIEVGIAHVNHQQRAESREEENYLRQFASELDIPFFVDYFTGTFTEKNARHFRYAFFKEVMKKEGYTALVTAHHADDQAETIFMRLLRGSRLLHVSGMVAVQPFGNGELIRPLLSFKKEELDELVHFEDASNQKDTYLRNRIRNTYIPLLAQENPRFSSTLLAVGSEISQVYQALSDLTKEMDITNLSVFTSQTPAVQAILLERYLEQFSDLQLGKAQFDEVLLILRNKANYRHSLKNGYYLLKDYQGFSIKKIQPQTEGEAGIYVLQSGDQLQLGELEIAVDVPLKDAQQVVFVEKGTPIYLRPRKAGDRILLNGVNKKLRRYFIDEKIPQQLRESALIIEQNGKIYGIANIVLSDLSKSLKNDTIKSTLYIKSK